MTLKLGIRIELEKGNVAAGAREAAREIDGIGASAEVASKGARVLGTSLEEMAARVDPTAAAALRYKRELAELRAAHEATAISGETLVRREAELKMAFEQTVSSIASRGAAMKRAAEASVARQTITPDRAADIAAYGAEMDALRAKYNPLWAAGQTYKTTIEDIARAERVGALTAVEATAARQRAKAATAAHVEALRSGKGALDGHTGAMKLNAMQATQLSYQLNDVFVSLASGQNPMMVAIQQGSQIGQIFGGIGNAAKAALAWITPTRAAIGLTIGGAIVAMKALDDRSRSLLNLKTSVDGVGRGVGATATQVADLAARSADAGGVSVAAAREMATEYARTGAIGEEHFGTLIRIQKSFAATIGQEVEPATKQLAEMIADPAKGAETLSRSYHLVDDASARVITRLAEQNRVTEAQALLLGVLEPRLVKASDAMLGYERLGQRARVNLSNMWEGIGKAESGIGDWISRKLLKATTGATDEQIDAGRARIREAEAAAAKMRRALEEADAAGKTGIAISDRSPSTEEQLRQIALQRELAAVEKSRSAPGLAPEEQTRIATAIDAKTRAQATWINEIERSRQIQEIDLAVMQSRDPVERAQLEHKRALIQLAGQEVTATQATTIAEQAYARVLGEVSAQARGNIADITADATARSRVNALVAAGAISLADANRELQIEAATRQLSIQLATAEGAERTRLLDLIRQTRSAIVAQDQAQRIASAQQSLASGNDRLETLRTEIALIGQSEAVRTRTLALLEAEQRIRREGLGGTAIADQIRAQAAATAELTTALERQKAAWGEIETTGSSAIDTITEGLRTGKDISKQLTDDITKELMKLTVANPLKNWLFGKNLPEIGDVSKTLFGGRGSATPASILPQAVGTATITAGTVVVNGGIAGAGAGVAGGLGAPANSNDVTGRVAPPVAVTRSDLPPPAANDNGGNARIAGAWDQFPTPQQRISGAWDQFPTPDQRIAGAWNQFPAGRALASRATGYSPQLGGDRIEGGYESSIRGPDGQAMVRTLDDYRLGRSDYVTLAGDPRFYGNRYSMPEVSYLSGGQRYSLQNVPGVVHDTGSAFRGAPEGRFDVALGRDLSFAERNQSMAGTQFIAQSSANASKAIEKLATSSEGASNQVLDLGKGLQSITGSGMGSGGSIAGASAEGSGGGLLGGLGGLLQSLFKSLFGGFGSIFSGLFGGFFADGSAFSAGSVVATPASIGMSGGRRGIIGEAGPEAVLPLARGADGKLGVVAAIRTTAAAQPMAISASELKRIAGSGGGASQPAPAPRVDVPITINNHAKADVSVQSRVGAGGGREYDILVRDIQDRMEDRYGLTPQKRRR